MGRNTWNRVGIFLIILSFIFIGGGFVVAYYDGDFIFSNSSTVVGHNDGNDINISTVNGEGPEGLTSGVDSNGGKNNINSENTGNNSQIPDSNSDANKPVVPSDNNENSNQEGGSTPNNDNSIQENLTPVVPDTPTIEDINNDLRNDIQSQYGILVKYGSETSGYNVGGMSTSQITDANVIKKALEDMKNTISLFPVGIWNEMKSSGYPLTIYLIDSYSSTNVTGVTESFSNRVTISIATKFSFSETFNHEVFHYFENFITQFRGADFNNWNSFNPLNFTYGSVNSSLSYTRTFSADSYFVNDYAQTQAAEDRASTFEYMMFDSKAACLNIDKPVWKKAKYMAEKLDNYLNSVSPNVIEYWERHL